MRPDVHPFPQGSKAEAYLSRDGIQVQGPPIDGNTLQRGADTAEQRAKASVNQHRHRPQESHELNLHGDATRDSMVDDLLCSFNELPDGRGPLRKLEPLDSSFYDNANKPRFAYDIIREYRECQQHFRSPSGDSDYDLRPAEYFTSYQEGSPSVGGTIRPRTAPNRQTAHDMEESQPSFSSPASTPQNRGHGRRRSKTASKDKKDGKGITHRGRRSVDHGLAPGRSRSSSFDLNVGDKPRRPPSNNYDPQSILSRRRPIPSEYHYFDAAPMPNVPLSRTQSPPRSPANAYSSKPSAQPNSVVSSLERNFVPQTSSRDKVANLTGSTAILAERQTNIEQSASHSSNQISYWEDSQSFTLPPLYGSRTQTTDPSTREKHGFFKRVFGSSRNQSPSVERSAPQLPPVGSVNAKAPPKSTRPVANTTSNATPIEDFARQGSEDPSIGLVESTQTLNKKSSFFRRWKKQNGKDDTPMPRNSTASHNQDLKRSPSASSLRQILDPFLADQTSPTQIFYDSKERQSNENEDRAFKNTEQSESPQGYVRVSKSGSPAQPESPVPRNSQSAQLLPKVDSPGEPESTSFRKVRSASALMHRATSGETTAQAEQEAATHRGRIRIIPASENADILDVRRPSATSALSKTSSVASMPDSNKAESDVLPQQTREQPRRVFVRVSDGDIPPNENILAREVSASSSRLGEASPAEGNVIPQLDGEASDSPVQVIVEDRSLQPSTEERELAQELFDGHENLVLQAKISRVLGRQDEIGERIRRAYMDLFDFSGLNILLALRDLCGRLVLKGETQQLDRILSSFSGRWCECNSTHGFKSQDIVHTLAYSLLLLNTDLHTADLDQRMTRAQFVKNTLPTLRQFALEQGFEGTSQGTPGQALNAATSRELRSPSPFSPTSRDGRPSLETRGSESRLSARPNRRPLSEIPSFTSPSPYDGRAVDAANLLVEGSFDGTLKGWETQMDMVLREFYTSIRQLRLPLLTHELPEEVVSGAHASTNGFGTQRYGTVLPKPQPDGRGRNMEMRSANSSRWSSKNRSAPRLRPTSTRGSSRTSFDEASVWSPSASSTWSKSVFGKTQTTMSTDSLASRLTQGDYGYQQSIGFANALSHAIVREEGANNLDADDGATNLLEDETLELAGAPWAKEGIVHHKHHLETTDRKARDRNWSECFAVVEKGWVRLFAFNTKLSMRSQKGKLFKGAVVGGGNWTENAEALSAFMLRQTIANVLPAPGYSRTRPHVFALSLPNGAVHLFQVGTPEIAKEFVSTANYWSARLSKEPLVGGISNIEYGWSEAVIGPAMLVVDSGSMASERPPSAVASTLVGSSKTSTSHKRSLSSVRPSLQGSFRGSLDLPSNARPKLPGDKVALSEWNPPVQSLMASSLTEAEQLEALKQYVKDVEEELTKHNELRPGLALAFSARHSNAAKALSNWERKSSYLLREIVKFRTYIDSLQAATAEHEKIKKEREERAAELATIRARAEARQASATSSVALS